MTNTKFRRRALLSSVAMLLVALVALGSATFAWFTQSTSATAQGINVKTVKASELKLQSMDQNWTDTLNYSYNQTLKPASSGNGTDWYKADAKNKGSYEASTSSIASAGSYSKSAQGISGYVFMNQLNVANFGGAAVNDVTINFSLSETAITSGANYVRFAVVEAAATGYGTNALPAFKSGASFSNSTVFANGAGQETEAFVPGLGSAVSTATITPTNAATSVSVSVGDLAGKTGDATMGGAKYYNIYVWFEGQDTDCKDANAGNELPNISISVTGNTVQA